MAVREALNQHPKAVIGTVAVLIVGAIALTFLTSGGGSSNAAGTGALNKAWYSDDDGKTWFADDLFKVAPFDHNGKQAYRAYVFTCDGGATAFVSHLERYTQRAKAQIEAQRAKADPNSPDDPGMELPLLESLEVKKPGQAQWISAQAPQAQAVVRPACPGGKGSPEPVLP